MIERSVGPVIRALPTGLHLSKMELRALILRALQEDVGSGDITTRLTIPEGMKARGTFRAQQDPLVVAGLPVAAAVFRVVDGGATWEAALQDGTEANVGSVLAVVTGRAATLLAGERVALNFLQRLSGIATLTRQLKARLAGLTTELLDTRKTTPGLRSLEKYAVLVGGGRNHRLRLDDGILTELAVKLAYTTNRFTTDWVSKRLRIFHHNATIGLKVFNITNHFNPRDFQGNLASARFGDFSNGVSRTFRGKFVIDF